MGTLSQLDILGRVVRSPRCRQLSFLPFNILRQPSISTKSTVVPQTAKDWENVLERAAGIHYDLYEMDMEVVSSDAAYMARETIAKNTAIHCELKIAIQEMKGGNTMYSYIGVSKLACRGCEV